jgi:hypothetical protein
MTSLSEIYAGILSFVQGINSQTQSVVTAQSAAASNLTSIALSSTITGTIQSTQVTPTIAEFFLNSFTVGGTSAAIDITSLASTLYTAIKINWQHITPTTDAVAFLFMQLGTSSTVFVTGAVYNYVNYTITSTDNVSFVGSSVAGGWGLSGGTIRSSAAVNGGGNNGTLTLVNWSSVAGANNAFFPVFHGTGIGLGVNALSILLGGSLLSSPPFTSFRMFLSSAPSSPSENFANGRIDVYGVI